MTQPDPNLSNLLKWSIENSTNPPPDPSDPSTDNHEARPSRPLDTRALASLFGGPSDADLMKESIAVIQNPSATLDNKLVAFDNFEQLIENLDNANNLSPLGLWTPLIELLKSEEAELRRMAAWCLGTAVQNNREAQERALVGGAVPALVGICIGKGESAKEEGEGVKRKARYAISSLIRNYQPGLDAVVQEMDGEQSVDAGDMEAVDRIMEKLGR
ncbi:hsp70 nucleotide exchange factor fes1 [Thelotrema lepadinum]|nr:hsp70 nucleotide exchange factor fes1 [Thelotrema lepadinum]